MLAFGNLGSRHAPESLPTAPPPAWRVSRRAAYALTSLIRFALHAGPIWLEGGGGHVGIAGAEVGTQQNFVDHTLFI